MFKIIKVSELIVGLEGRFDAAQLEKAEDALSEFSGSITVDMKNLEYISSAGLGLLLRTLTRLKSDDHTLTLKNMNKHIREVLKYSGLDKIFKIEE
jgi:anti-sigma B factor antagonist